MREHHDPGADEHDLGLLHDLDVLAARRRAAPALPPAVHRRTALQVLGGVGLLALLAGCTGGDGGTAAKEGTTSPTTGATTSSSASADGRLSPIPSEAAGPFPGDGSNGPDALRTSGVVRRDIRPSFGGATGRAEGVPLTVQLELRAAATGRPLAGAAVYLWHCDRDGRYSMYEQPVVAENYLRGVQAAGADGVVELLTAYPGCYAGRWPHMHFEVFESLAGATAARSKLRTSQLALPEAANREVYATDGYGASLRNASRLRLARDGVFADDGGARQLASVSGSVQGGLTMRLVVPV